MSLGYQQVMQEALHLRLTQTPEITDLLANGGADIFNHVPENTSFPYCRMYIRKVEKIDTKLSTALALTVSVQTYDKNQGDKNMQMLSAEILNALDNAQFDLSDYNVIDCRFDREQMDVFDGGRVRMCTQIFKIIMRSSSRVIG